MKLVFLTSLVMYGKAYKSQFVRAPDFKIQAEMSQLLDAPPSGHSSPAIDEYLLLGEGPWNCWHLRFPWAEITQSKPS